MACLSGAVLLDNKQTNLVWCDARSLKSSLERTDRRSRRDEDDDSASVAPFRNNDSFAGLGNSLLQPFEDEG